MLNTLQLLAVNTGDEGGSTKFIIIGFIMYLKLMACESLLLN
jgi:hypothetical protein